jgi:hypothetical protein
MKVSENFFVAKKDKALETLLVIQRMENKTYGSSEQELKTYIRLVIRQKNKYDIDSSSIFVETPTEIKIDNYSGSRTGHNSKTEVNTIVFHCNTYHFHNFPKHVETFLKAIKKESEVSFFVVAYNSNDNIRAVNWVHHQLFGQIDGKDYFLSDYTGPDNSASPVR